MNMKVRVLHKSLGLALGGCGYGVWGCVQDFAAGIEARYGVIGGRNYIKHGEASRE